MFGSVIPALVKLVPYSCNGKKTDLEDVVNLRKMF
jgi:hypothetical protein